MTSKVLNLEGFFIKYVGHLLFDVLCHDELSEL